MSEFAETPAENTAQAAEHFDALLTGMANHESKFALAAIIAAQPERFFRLRDLDREITRSQGSEPGWVPDPKSITQICNLHLIPARLVRRGEFTTERGPMPIFFANNEKPQVVAQGFAMSGALLEWSLDFPATSTQSLGKTRANSAHSTPELRYGIFHSLTGEQQVGAAQPEIVTALGARFTEKNVIKNIADLSKSGLLDVRGFDITKDTTLEIINPDFWHTRMYFSDLKSSSRVVYTALQRLWYADKREITFQDLAAEAAIIDPDLDPSVLRSYWRHGASTAAESMPGLKPASRALSERKRTWVTISPAHREAITELVRRLEVIRLDADSWPAYRRTANRILSSPSKMADILAKSKRFSTFANMQVETTQDKDGRILALLETHGTMTAAEIHHELTANTDSKISLASVYQYLYRLGEDQTIAVEQRRPDPASLRKVLYYSLPPQPPENPNEAE